MNAKILLIQGKSPDPLVTQTLQNSQYVIIDKVDKSKRLLDVCAENKPDIVIFNIDVLDDTSLAEIQDTNQQSPLPMIIFSSDRCKSTIASVIKAGVSAYVVDNLAAHRIDTIIEIAINRFNERQKITTELEKTKTQLADRKLIERAKGILIETRGLKEDEAYHTLRKLAMDRKIGMGEMAKNVIAMASLLENSEK